MYTIHFAYKHRVSRGQKYITSIWILARVYVGEVEDNLCREKVKPKASYSARRKMRENAAVK